MDIWFLKLLLDYQLIHFSYEMQHYCSFDCSQFYDLKWSLSNKNNFKLFYPTVIVVILKCWCSEKVGLQQSVRLKVVLITQLLIWIDVTKQLSFGLYQSLLPIHWSLSSKFRQEMTCIAPITDENDHLPATDVNDGGNVAAESFPRGLGSLREDERFQNLRWWQQRDQRQQMSQKNSGEVASEVLLTPLELGRIVPGRRLIGNLTQSHQHFLTYSTWINDRKYDGSYKSSLRFD